MSVRRSYAASYFGCRPLSAAEDDVSHLYGILYLPYRTTNRSAVAGTRTKPTDAILRIRSMTYLPRLEINRAARAGKKKNMK